MVFQHIILANGRWQDFSFREQMGTVGSEINRALNWRGRDEELSRDALYRALELMDFILQDRRWHERLKEPARVREVICDVLLGGKEYGSTLEDLNRYFFIFALAARLNK